jgi:hypothetical protein
VALDRNLTTMANVEASLARRFAALLRLGLLDPPSAQPFLSIPATALGWHATPPSAHGRTGAALNLESARQSVVMLKRGPLPFRGGQPLSVIGPLANATGYLLGTYRGAICPGYFNSTSKGWEGNQCSSAHHSDRGCYCVPTGACNCRPRRVSST